MILSIYWGLIIFPRAYWWRWYEEHKVVTFTPTLLRSWWVIIPLCLLRQAAIRVSKYVHAHGICYTRDWVWTWVWEIILWSLFHQLSFWPNFQNCSAEQNNDKGSPQSVKSGITFTQEIRLPVTHRWGGGEIYVTRDYVSAERIL